MNNTNSKIVPVIAAVVMVLLIVGSIIIFSVFKNSKGTSGEDGTKTTKSKTNGLTQSIDRDSILESTDAGDTFVPQFKLSEEGDIGLADVLSVAFHSQKEGYIVVGSVSDGLFRREAGKETWEQFVFPPKNIYSFILDKNDPDNRLFASGAVNENGRIFRSTDGGENWKPVYTEPGLKTLVTSLSQHHKNTNIIFAGTSAGTVIKSVDGGSSWKNLGNQIKGTIKDVNFDATKKDVAYLLTYGSTIYYSPDGGLTWIDWEEAKEKEVDALETQARAASRAGNKSGAEALNKRADDLAERNKKNKMPENPIFIVADPNTSGVLYASAESGLYRSKDYGKYWAEINIIESAKSHPIRSVAINPKNSKEIVFTAGTSFYKSTNSGETWSVTPLGTQRDASFIVYDPFNTQRILIGVSSVQTSKASRNSR
jgi:photosystem II stability/assembly factor-like uncharacterized protein